MTASSSKRKPLKLHIHDSKKHMGDEERDARADAEVTMGEIKFSPPGWLKENLEAMKKWREITKIYKESGLCLVSSTDNGVLARYCILYAEYVNLVRQRRTISELDFPQEDEAEILSITAEEFNIARAKRLWRVMEYFTCMDGVIKLDKAINAKAKSVLDVEDRIFLNPASKVRTLPIKRKPKEKDAMGDMGFDV